MRSKSMEKSEEQRLAILVQVPGKPQHERQIRLMKYGLEVPDVADAARTYRKPWSIGKRHFVNINDCEEASVPFFRIPAPGSDDAPHCRCKNVFGRGANQGAQCENGGHLSGALPPLGTKSLSPPFTVKACRDRPCAVYTSITVLLSVSLGKYAMRRYLTLLLLVLLALPCRSLQLTAGVAEMPVHAEATIQGILIDLVNALSEESGADIKIQVLPFARSMQFVKNHKLDFHLPLIQAPYARGHEQNYDVSTATLFHVNFVLYENRHNPVDLSHPEDFTIETDIAHKDYFDFNIHATACLECSIKKVNSGRVDGLIYADNAIDPLVKMFNLTHIRRKLYKTFEVKIVFPKGGRGGPLDRMLSQAIGELRSSGKLKRILGTIDQPYDNWQPTVNQSRE